MSNYRRAKFAGGYYFFTVLTYRRRKLFVDDGARRDLRDAWQKVQQKYPFEIIALCLLPEHVHCVWEMPEGDADFCTRWRLIKSNFTRSYLRRTGREAAQSESRHRKGERGVWQRRFWEHQIRDENDLQNHIDYIHYNPVKHDLVRSAEDWPWSTYQRFVERRFYEYRRLDDLDGGFGEVVGE